MSSEQWGRNASVLWHGALGYSELAEPCGVTGDHRAESSLERLSMGVRAG